MEEFNHLVIKEERLTKEDFDLAKEKIRQLFTFIKKENERRKEPGSDTNGWFSVRVDNEKQEEKMKNRLPLLFQNDLNLLLKAGWLEESCNPILNWESLKQYRVNLIKMNKEISHKTLADLNMVLNEESPLPYFFDLIHYEKLSNTKLKEHIDTIGIEIYNENAHISL